MHKENKALSDTRKTYLVTGASGFIGGHLCEALCKAGARVRAMVRETSDTTHLDGLDLELCRAELGDSDSLDRACDGVDIVIHTAAAVGSFGEWAHFHETGVLGTQRLIAAAERHRVARFVHVSSIAVYGFRPHGRRLAEDAPFDRRPQRWNHYVREKVLSEELVWAAHAAGKISATVLRPAVVIGARDRNAVPRMADLLRLPVSGLPGRPSNRFPVVTIDDCVDAIVRAAAVEAAVGRAYNVSGARSIGLAEIYGLVAKHAGLRAPGLYLPTALVLPLTGALEAAWKLLGKAGEPIATRIAIVLSGYDYDIDCDRALRELGWRADGDYEAAIVAALALPNPAGRGSRAA